MHRIISLCVAAFTTAGLLAYGADAPRGEPAGIAELLRARIEAGDAFHKIVAYGDLVYCSDAVEEFYERRAFRPAWVTKTGPSPQADSLLAAIEGADAEGLNPGDYHLVVIRDLLRTLGPAAKSRSGDRLRVSERRNMLTDLDLLLSDAFLVYGSHLLGGRVDPRRIEAQWRALKRKGDLIGELEAAVASGRPAPALRRLLPPQEGYRRLRETLRHYRDISAAGGWPEVGGRRELGRGSRGSAVAALRTYLLATGDLRGLTLDGADIFDKHIERAVIRFQKRHGLRADGLVGPATRAALNVPVEDRIEQIEINMERFRWLPRDLGRRHVTVNIASFALEVIENGRRISRMRVVVGRDCRRTPAFSDTVTYLVMNPRWNVPETIALEDIIPEARRDPRYIAQNRIRILEGWGAGAREIDPKSVNWSSIDTPRLKCRFVQDPGPRNSLGRIKFMFPNEFHVYIHDTPAKGLFDRTERTFSSGCIWVERPVDLAEYLLRGAPGWTRHRIVKVMGGWDERTVRLPEPIPIHILYSTAFVNDDGAINFRKDVYNRDRRLLKAFRQPPPAPAGPTVDPLMN